MPVHLDLHAPARPQQELDAFTQSFESLDVVLVRRKTVTFIAVFPVVLDQRSIHVYGGFGVFQGGVYRERPQAQLEKLRLMHDSGPLGEVPENHKLLLRGRGVEFGVS
jgi:hypothetical protein